MLSSLLPCSELFQGTMQNLIRTGLSAAAAASPTAAASPLLKRERLPAACTLDMEQIPGEAGMQPHEELKPEAGHQQNLMMEGEWQLAAHGEPLWRSDALSLDLVASFDFP